MLKKRIQELERHKNPMKGTLSFTRGWYDDDPTIYREGNPYGVYGQDDYIDMDTKYTAEDLNKLSEDGWLVILHDRMKAPDPQLKYAQKMTFGS